MAKRKRLTLPDTGGPPADLPQRAPETKAMQPFGMAPIAQVAGDAAATAALQDLAQDVIRARHEGRLLQALPLAEVDEAWLVRDRLAVDADDLASLSESLRAHGQRMAIEVVDRGADTAPRYGLISGWRRLAALRALLAETNDPRFATVLAVLRRPETAGDAYVAMVEENEIRAGLSYYERARIAALAVEAGVFPTRKMALQRLYANASRARRSKIGSFLAVHAALGGVLRFPAAIPERLGLALAMRIEADAGFAPALIPRLQAGPAAGPAEELAMLAQALKGKTGSEKAEKAVSEGPVAVVPGIVLRFDRSTQQGEIRLTGPAVDDGLRDRLLTWLCATVTGGPGAS